jgi:NAD(P)-dependent dehydrogenase (short-subunit alcohol dehydrogenase family)
MSTTPAVALVTGASHGLGLEVARQLAQRGMTVLLTARDSQQGTQAARQVASEGLDVRFKRLDVSDGAGVRALAEELDREYGRLDVLVNNAAGQFDFAVTALAADLDAARAVFEVNLFGAWRVAQACAPLLRKSQHPRLVNVGSGAGTFGAPEGLLANRAANLPAYALSKLALAGLTIKLAAELADSSVLVNAVCPGTTATYPGMEAIPGARPVAQGAASIVWAALLPDDGPTGGYFRDGQPLPW